MSSFWKFHSYNGEFFLLGLDTELYYVKNGIVNNYAVGYVLTVNSTIEELEFTWQNLAQQAVGFLLFLFSKSNFYEIPLLLAPLHYLNRI